jgi:dihydroneopterin aldolase
VKANSSHDRIVLTGLRAIGRHGVFPGERTVGQVFIVDAELDLDLAPAGTTDDLGLTVDYGRLADQLVAIVQGEPVNLIETLAERLALACLNSPTVRSVMITVHKPHAPINQQFEDVAVSIRRYR